MRRVDLMLAVNVVAIPVVSPIATIGFDVAAAMYYKDLTFAQAWAAEVTPIHWAGAFICILIAYGFIFFGVRRELERAKQARRSVVQAIRGIIDEDSPTPQPHLGVPAPFASAQD